MVFLTALLVGSGLLQKLHGRLHLDLSKAQLFLLFGLLIAHLGGSGPLQQQCGHFHQET
jgi:hypothetical protein